MCNAIDRNKDVVNQPLRHLALLDIHCALLAMIACFFEKIRFQFGNDHNKYFNISVITYEIEMRCRSKPHKI